MQDNSFSQGKDPLSPEFHQPAFFWPRVHSVCSKPRSAVTTAWCLLMGKSGRIWPRLSLQVLLANSCPQQWRSLLCLLPTESSCPRSLSAPGLWHPPLSSLLHHNFTLLCVFWTVVLLPTWSHLLSTFPDSYDTCSNHHVLFYTSQ